MVSLQRGLKSDGCVADRVHRWPGSISATASTAPAAHGPKSTAAASSPSSARTAPRPSPRRRPSASSPPEFFARHSIADLDAQPEYWLSQQGRLTHPMVLRPGDDHYRPDRLGRRLPADRRRAARARRPRRSGLLHLRPHQQRGGVPLPVDGPQLRHQQPARLLATCATNRRARRWSSRSASARDRSPSRTSPTPT